MLNLSDKELDRFSQEAAQEYEPGDVLGPRSWERLEVRITQEFGRPGWNPMRHIRRFPFYYAPALLILLGVGYYFLRPGVSSGSSPGATVGNPTGKTSVQTQNSVSNKATSTPGSSSTDLHGDAAAAGATASGAADGKAVTASGTANGAAASGAAASGSAATRGSAAAGGSGAADGSAASGANRDNRANATDMGNGKAVASRTSTGRKVGAGAGASAASGSGSGVAGNARIGSGRIGSGGGASRGVSSRGVGSVTAARNPGGGNISSKGNGAAALTNAERELSLSSVQRPRWLGKRGLISDSALRAFNAKVGVPAPIKRKGVYEISRKWQFGLLVAPDFTSVNSLAGDKAGSSIGLTVDYLFAPHWYLSTGILATRRNYAARSQDYHAPPKFYQQNNIYGGVSFVKGSFYMMEVPLNLRYDFSIAGNTYFFISAGTSSYLMTTENANLYWRHFNTDECNTADHLPIHRTNLFSTVNLSAGVEAGVSNSLSLLIAPYMKLPTKSLGLGQVQMNSVGIDFILKWAPVTGRKRR